MLREMLPLPILRCIPDDLRKENGPPQLQTDVLGVTKVFPTPDSCRIVSCSVASVTWAARFAFRLDERMICFVDLVVFMVNDLVKPPFEAAAAAVTATTDSIEQRIGQVDTVSSAAHAFVANGRLNSGASVGVLDCE